MWHAPCVMLDMECGRFHLYHNFSTCSNSSWETLFQGQRGIRCSITTHCYSLDTLYCTQYCTVRCTRCTLLYPLMNTVLYAVLAILYCTLSWTHDDIYFVFGKTVRTTFWCIVVFQWRGDCSRMWEDFMDPGSESTTNVITMPKKTHQKCLNLN